MSGLNIEFQQSLAGLRKQPVSLAPSAGNRRGIFTSSASDIQSARARNINLTINYHFMNIKELLFSATLLAILAVIVTVAFSKTAPSPENAVTRMFQAYQHGDREAVNSMLSAQGHRSADAFCGGQTIACLRANYGDLGKNLTQDVSFSHSTDNSARLVLKTTWDNYAQALCQDYSVERTPTGWGVSYIDNPRHC